MTKHPGWPVPATPVAQVTLAFGPDCDRDTLGNFSAGSRIGDALFLGADEHGCLERLSRVKSGHFAGHVRYNLCDLLELADPDGEIDIEGLAVDEDWLWIVGSHARTRPKVRKADDRCIDLDALANLKDTRSRCLLARLPLVPDAGGVPEPVRHAGKRRAGLLKQTKHGNALAEALAADPLLKPFTRVPAKEGGLDVEGIAVCDNRVALGLRGPVIGSDAVLLEVEIKTKKGGALHLVGDPVKRLLDLEGLGIRDLKRCGDDLLILAGPTTGLSGPCALYRWRDWANDPPQDARKVRLHQPERVIDLPFGRGVDHPEGLALWEEGGARRGVLVIYDSPAEARVDRKKGTIDADLFQLPD